MAKAPVTGETPEQQENQNTQETGNAAITLDEFCLLLSGSDRRVEMIGAFNHDELQLGHVKDTESNYRSRFDAFAKRPA